MMAEALQSPRGTRDLLPAETALWQAAEQAFRRAFAAYGYGEIRTPIFEDRGHFLAAAAEAMRRILIDSARRKEARKRGAGLQRVDLEDVDLAAKADDTVLLRLHEALEKLAREDPPSAELVKLRFFAGLTTEQAAAALGISERTARRYWVFARAWLHDELGRSSGV
jgi:RNA polymerase sigma factor (TIGR02999 family)